MKSRMFLSVVVVPFTAWTLVTSFEPSPKAALIAQQKTNAAGQVTELIWRQGNEEWKAKKIK